MALFYGVPIVLYVYNLCCSMHPLLLQLFLEHNSNKKQNFLYQVDLEQTLLKLFTQVLFYLLFLYGHGINLYLWTIGLRWNTSYSLALYWIPGEEKKSIKPSHTSKSLPSPRSKTLNRHHQTAFLSLIPFSRLTNTVRDPFWNRMDRKVCNDVYFTLSHD